MFWGHRPATEDPDGQLGGRLARNWAQHVPYAVATEGTQPPLGHNSVSSPSVLPLVDDPPSKRLETLAGQI